VEQLMKAAEDCDINTLKYLIEEKQIDVNTHDTHGPYGPPWVSQVASCSHSDNITSYHVHYRSID